LKRMFASMNLVSGTAAITIGLFGVCVIASLPGMPVWRRYFGHRGDKRERPRRVRREDVGWFLPVRDAGSSK